jgi:hypothetical protein
MLPMSGRDSSKYTLWFISGDRQGSMFGGNYDSEEKAENAIEELEKELRSECCEFDEDGYFQIEPPDSNSDDDDQ